MSALPQYLPGGLEASPSLPTLPAATAPAARPSSRTTSLLRSAQQVLNILWMHVRQHGNQLGLLKARQRRLRVSETLSLGDKRFVSILEVDGQAFLLGSSNSGLSLLATLTPAPQQASFDQLLRDSFAQGDA